MLRKRGHRVVCSRIQTVDSRTIWVVCSCRKVKLHYLQAQQLGKPGLTGCTLDFPDKGFLCEVSRAWFPSCCHPMETHQASHFLHPVRLLTVTGVTPSCVGSPMPVGYSGQRADETLGNSPGKLWWAKTGLEDPRWALGEQVHGMWYFTLQYADTVGWATGRASGL